MTTILERVWFGDEAVARTMRALLRPAAGVYGGIGRIRNAMFDRGMLASRDAGVPVVSIGNLSVGGTGKTPIAAWVAGRLRHAGAHPAVLMRGYGGDEPLVHARLNPEVPVVAMADRVAGAARARAAGADCIVLDDGFQHRRLRRAADWVLVSAERAARSPRLLPAGPWREPPSALARATLLVVTRKTVSLAEAGALADRLGPMTSSGFAAVSHLRPHALVDARDGATSPLGRLEGTRILAVAAIGEPEAFFLQVRACGATALVARAFPDHHRFSSDDVRALVRQADAFDGVVCTLKDAVKLAGAWPRAGPPLWYVSQHVVIERGASALDASIEVILSARAGISSTAGAAG